jgi:hypothetical protein
MKARSQTMCCERAFGNKGRRRRTLPPSLLGSTIRPARLNDRVRDGNGCDPRGKAADQIQKAEGRACGGESLRSLASSPLRNFASTPGKIGNGKIEFESCAVLLHEEWHTVLWTSQATRAISTARLSILLCLHLQPIDVLVSNGPSGSLRSGKIRLEGGFPLRCFQRFSGPDIATRRCHWHDSRYTRGQSVPVLSY